MVWYVTVSHSSPNGSHLPGWDPSSMTFLVFLTLQIDRILSKAHPHATGPKKPDSSMVESRKERPNG